MIAAVLAALAHPDGDAPRTLAGLAASVVALAIAGLGAMAVWP